METNTIEFIYKTDDNTEINYKTSSLKTLEDLTEDFRRFLMAIGFHQSSVDEIKTLAEIDDDCAIMLNRVKNALEYLDNGNIEKAKETLNDIYN